MSIQKCLSLLVDKSHLSQALCKLSRHFCSLDGDEDTSTRSSTNDILFTFE